MVASATANIAYNNHEERSAENEYVRQNTIFKKNKREYHKRNLLIRLVFQDKLFLNGKVSKVHQI